MSIDVSRTGSQRHVADIFNSAVAAWAIGAAWEVGALDELRQSGKLDAQEFAARHGLDGPSTEGLFRALAAVRVVERDGSTVTVAAAFDDVYRNRAFVHWLSRGSAELFRQMPSILRTENRTGRFYQRDAAAIAYACRELDALCYAPTFWAAMERARPTGLVVDLGCGSGGRLLDVLRRYPGTSGLGVDIARPSLDVAERDAAAAGLADRLRFVEGDVLRLEPRPEFAEVEVITCFMMGHDFWPRDRCLATLSRLREVFPAARRFILGDATRTSGIPDTELPVFTLGFELGHDLMGIRIPTIPEWQSVFAASQWRLLRTNRIEMTVGEVVFELA
ncbi:class I SAM-dependent methyltransferase [Micromonospora sp. NPDC051543]|uniref:class I SAM-dependent methyltransferase n=1 Tax=Micromonospora sp. NPDC051543 TaxID=3364287 RepID=UPI003799A482